MQEGLKVAGAREGWKAPCTATRAALLADCCEDLLVYLPICKERVTTTFQGESAALGASHTFLRDGLKRAQQETLGGRDTPSASICLSVGPS